MLRSNSIFDSELLALLPEDTSEPEEQGGC